MKVTLAVEQSKQSSISKYQNQGTWGRRMKIEEGGREGVRGKRRGKEREGQKGEREGEERRKGGRKGRREVEKP